MPGTAVEFAIFDEVTEMLDVLDVAAPVTTPPLQLGDYIKTTGFTQEQYEYAINAFLQLRTGHPNGHDEGPTYRLWRNYRCIQWCEILGSAIVNMNTTDREGGRERTLADLESLTGIPAPTGSEEPAFNTSPLQPGDYIELFDGMSADEYQMAARAFEAAARATGAFNAGNSELEDYQHWYTYKYYGWYRGASGPLIITANTNIYDEDGPARLRTMDEIRALMNSVEPLQAGDFVSTQGITRDQYKAVVQAFRTAYEAERGPLIAHLHELEDYEYTGFNYFGWCVVARGDGENQYLLNLSHNSYHWAQSGRERKLVDILRLVGRPKPATPQDNTIVFDPTKLRRQELESAIRYQNGRMEEARAELASARERLEKSENWLKIYDEWAQLPDETMSTQLRVMVEKNLFTEYTTANHRNAVPLQKRAVEAAKKRIAEIATRLLNFNREKAQLKGEPITFTRNQMEADLRNIPQYVHDSVYVGVNTISWNLTGVLMQPDENPYSWIDGGRIPTIRLPDLQVKLTFQHDGAVRVTLPFPDDTPNCAPSGYADHGTPHPHVLDDFRPCLGDFEGAVSNAAQQGDLRTANDILLAFLSQAYNNDPAGREWWRWLLTNWDNPDEHCWFLNGDHHGNEAYFWDSSDDTLLNVTTNAEGYRDLHWGDKDGVHCGCDSLLHGDSDDEQLSDDEYRDEYGDICCRHCDYTTDGGGRFTNSCECCGTCEQSECGCCDICGGLREDCDCCRECDRTAERCICEPEDDE